MQGAIWVRIDAVWAMRLLITKHAGGMTALVLAPYSCEPMRATPVAPQTALHPSHSKTSREIMQKRNLISSLVTLSLITTAITTSTLTVHASGVVGTGTAASCTEAAFASALSGGGAVSFNCGASPVTITMTTLRTLGRSTTIDGGGLITFSGGGLRGGLFKVDSAVTLNLNNLTLRDSGDPGVSASNNAQVNIANTTFTGFTREAIYNDSGQVSISASTILSNSAGFSGGAIGNSGVMTITGSLFQYNATPASFIGGVIANTTFHGPGIVAIDRTTFRDNQSGYGGVIANASVLTITNSLILSNTATFNGGSGGGAIYTTSGSNVSLTNVTFSGNSVPSNDHGAAIYFAGNTPTQARLQNVSIVDNIAATVVNASLAFVNSGLVVTMTNTLIRGAGCYMAGGAKLVDGGGNLAFNNVTNNVTGCPGVNADPQLTPLQDNGGPTLTYAITSSASPAFNGGINAGCPAFDQRGVIRPQQGTCDIGAVERLAQPLFSALTPPTLCAGAASALITATGANLISGPSGTRILSSLTPIPTIYVSPTQLQATLGATDLALPAHTLSFTLDTPVLDGGPSPEEHYIQVQNCTDVGISGLTATSDSPTNLGNTTLLTATVATGNNVTYAWDYGDGQTGTGATPTHLYVSPGSYIAVVTATNTLGSARADTVVNVNRNTTGVLVGDLSSRFGAVITYTYIVTYVAGLGNAPMTINITGNVPAGAVLVSSPGLTAVATGGDDGNGFVQTPTPVTLEPGQSTTIVWSVRPLVWTGDIVNEAHGLTSDGLMQLFQRNRVRRALLSLIYR